MSCEFLKIGDWSLWTDGPRILSWYWFYSQPRQFNSAEKEYMSSVNFRKGLIINFFLSLHRILWFQFRGYF